MEEILGQRVLTPRSMSTLDMQLRESQTMQPTFFGRVWGETKMSKMSIFSKYVEITEESGELLFRQGYETIREWCVPTSGDMIELSYNTEEDDNLVLRFQTVHAFEAENLIIKYTHLMAGLEPPPAREYDGSIILQGYLTKKGGLVKNLKERWFILHSSNTLFYYQRPKDRPTTFVLKGSIQLKQAKLGVTQSPGQLGFYIQTQRPGGRKYVMSAPDEEAHRNWIEALSRIVELETAHQ